MNNYGQQLTPKEQEEFMSAMDSMDNLDRLEEPEDKKGNEVADCQGELF